MPDVVTVREAVCRAKQDGYPISEGALRGWIRSGTLPVRNAGKKSLIFYPNLLRYLRCEDAADNLPQTFEPESGIRRIEVKA